MIRPFITACKTLTIIPIPGKDCDDFSKSLAFFPFIGGIIAVFEIGVWQIGLHSMAKFPMITAFFMVAFGIIINGAIHCDGLADFCDGFFGGKIKEQILLIMKDPRNGSFGTIALILNIGFRFILYMALISENAVSVVACSFVFSRSMQGFMVSFSKSARNGSGTAGAFLQGKSSKSIMIVSILIAAVTLGFLFGYIKVSILLIASLISTLLFMLVCHKKINGITGDCIGALNEITEDMILFIGILVI